MKTATTIIALFLFLSTLSFASAYIYFNDEDIFLHCDNNEKYNVSGAEKKHVYYNTGADAEASINSNMPYTYIGQSFTPSNSFSITKARLKLRMSNPESDDIIISIFLVNDSGIPITTDRLSQGILDSGEVTTDAGGDWYYIDMSSYTFKKDTPYYIAATYQGREIPYWQYDSTSSTYTGGSWVDKQGVTWTIDTSKDFMFEIYGTRLQNFDHIVIADDHVQFNDTAFHCDFDGETVNTTINFLNIIEAYGNLTILNFSFEQSGSNFLEWNITNFQNNQVYRIYTNDSYMDDITSDIAGWLNFTVDIYEGFVEIVQYEYILFFNENPENNSWVIFNLSGHNTSLAIEYSNFNPASDNHLIVNLSWWNATSGSWQYYLNTTIELNKTVYMLNVNFSDVYHRNYLWKCEALANDTGITRTGTFGFSVFPYLEEKEVAPLAMGVSFIGGVGLCFSLLLKKTNLFAGVKRKKKKA